MRVSAGTRLGPYQIVAPVGAGGMGEVYRARDTRLARDVAIKVLPESMAGDAERRARFEREAKAVAALDHPHICGIYDVGEANGTHYLVMPLLEGQTLAARLENGPLSVTEALKTASEIADALDRAHRQGIVHRDLKPANVMLTKSGVKLLDFGLAKLRPSTGAVALSGAQSATTSAGTAEGTILGTIHYMAPEQVEGKEADHRADIWAFGVVLYEMVTGSRPFQGDTAASVVGAILKDTPSAVSSRQPLTPRALDFVVERCLAKDPDERWQSVGDLGRQLRWLAQVPEVGEPAAKAAPTRSRIPWLVAAAGLLLGIGSLWASRSTPSNEQTPPPVTRLELSLPPGAEVSTVAAPSASMSPDGRRVVFTAQEGGFRRLYVRDLDQPTAKLFVATDASSQCYFSADGMAVVFVSSDRTVRRLTLADGLSTVLARGVDRNFGATWGTDGQVTFAMGGALSQVPGNGGEARQITTVNRPAGELFHAWPSAVPGRSAVLFTVVSGGTRDAHKIDVVDSTTRERRTVVDVGSYPMLAADGPLVFLRDGVLVAAPLDRERMVLTGPAVKVADDMALDMLGAPQASLSASGSLVYVSTAAIAAHLMAVNRSGLMAPIIAERKAYDYPRLSPDGTRVMVSVSGDLWQVDLARSSSTRVTAESAVGNSYGVWAPGGSRVVFRTATGLRVSSADGSGGTEAIAETGPSDFPHLVTRDGRTLLFTRQTADASGDVYLLSLTGPPSPRALFSSPTYEGGGVLSPDERWVAYASNETGQYEVYVRSFPDGGRKFKASVDGGSQPMWSRDGRELFYRNRTRMLAVPVTKVDDQPLGSPTVLFDEELSAGTGTTFAHYDVLHDGRFVMIKRGPESGRLNVVLNWTTELNRLTRRSD